MKRSITWGKEDSVCAIERRTNLKTKEVAISMENRPINITPINFFIK